MSKKSLVLGIIGVLLAAGTYLVWTGQFGIDIGRFFAAEPSTHNDPQYIFVRKDNTCSDCFLWNGHWPDQYNAEALQEISDAIGTKGTPARRLGVGVLFIPNHVDLSRTEQSLRNLLKISLENDFPVYISIDNFDWWASRPELWFWWEEGISLEEKARRKRNVEWTDWDGDLNDEHAVQLGWRNWGFQLRVRPHPNLLSEDYLDNSIKNLRQLVPIIADWYEDLPRDKKYLLGGVDVGNELDIGGNFFFYENGNSYLDQDPSGDPQTFLPGTVQVGYAALKTSGIKSSGTVTSELLNQVVSQHLNILNKEMYDLGIPRNKIYNHTGGRGSSPEWVYPSDPVFTDIRSSVTKYAYPGWSFYGDITANPQNNALLRGALDTIEGSEWGIPEWHTFASDYDGWLTAIRNSLNHRNNRFINISNWEGGQGVRDKPHALAAIRTALGESPTCWVTSPKVNSETSGDSVTLSWTGGDNNDATFLQVTTDDTTTQAGTFELVNVTNSNVTGQNEFSRSGLSDGTYHWLIASDGCDPVQRRITYGSFVITTTDTTTSQPGDVDGDGDVDIFDYNLVVSNFGGSGAGDADGDGDVDIFDYNLVVSNFGQ